MAVDVVERALVVWCPDWSVAATQLPMSSPVAVMYANRVAACSSGARNEGVAVGLRRREAQARCPELIVIDHLPERDARMFEPVVVTVEAVAPRVEIVAPGLCAVPTRGPSRYFGGDEALVRHVTLLVQEALRGNGISAECMVGVADGVFAAALAAKAGLVVPPGGSKAFLAPQPIDVLDRLELVDLLKRLGIRTLGDFAALPAPDVLGRFGIDGAVAHRLAQGLDEQPFQARTPPEDFLVESVLEPPIQRIDTAAFVAKTMAGQLHEKLATQGLSCTQVVIESETEHGETLSRVWRHDGRLTAAAIAERVRWQLDGWLSARVGDEDEAEDGYEPTGGLTLLRLIPDGLLPDNGRQLGFWGGSLDADERTARALTRVQGMLGEDGVVTAVVGGGRSPSEQVRLVPWGVAREPAKAGSPAGVRSGSTSGAPAKTSARKARIEVPAWPGQLPSPAPATVYTDCPPASVVDENGQSVAVNGRGLLSAHPKGVAVSGGPVVAVVAWAGPWLVDERWWDPVNRHRKARLQVQTQTGDAYLLSLEQGSWRAEARYD